MATPQQIYEEIDRALLKEIERWRNSLVHNIALRNPTLPQRELNVAVQYIITRLLFLQRCEERSLEPQGWLMALQNGNQVYRRLAELFGQIDNRCHVGLFHCPEEKSQVEASDDPNLDLTIDDKVLKNILKNLYAPNSPYEFSALPANILGRVYEQGLDQTIRLTRTGQAVVEDKPEIKKGSGVYYTPPDIVDYIVQQTVGKLVEGKQPGPGGGVGRLKILDPACGSGAFLIGAYQFLLDWHRDHYLAQLSQVANAKVKIRNLQSKIYQAPGGAWRLTIAERKRILLNNIYGVDIDPQAVAVTRLSLLLKLLEGESTEPISQRQAMPPGEALPDLRHNIKCGNALIGPDFYESQPITCLDEAEKYHFKPFDWQAEFPEIMAVGGPSSGSGQGFDAVIGNPPYIDAEWMSRYLPACRHYCGTRYRAAAGNWDIFCVFIEKAFDLCQAGGLTSLIVPNKLGSADYAAGARAVLAGQNRLISIRDYAHLPVFPVAVYPIVYVAQKAPPHPGYPVTYERMGRSTANTIELLKVEALDYERYFADPHRPWPIFSDIHETNLIERLRRQFPPLSSMADVLGAATVSEAYALKPLIQDCPDRDTTGLKVVNSGTIDRYQTLWGQKKCRYLGHLYLRPIIPANQKKHLPQKRKQQAEQPKIIVAGMTKGLECTVDLEGVILAGKSTSIIRSTMNLKYLLGLLNSQLLTFYYQTIFGGNKMQGGYLQIGPPQLRQLPIRPIDSTDPTGRAYHDRVVEWVGRMLTLHKQLAEAPDSQAQTVLRGQIEAVDRQIDRLVYALYGLTEEEIKVFSPKVRARQVGA